MHKALYRKWRPQVFEDVVGQDYIVTVLKNQIETGKIGHAYLFTGSRGTGKTTCAKIFAKAVNCTAPHSGDPCLECDICKSISDGSAVDVEEIDAASHTGVDNIRDIIERSAFLPVTCKYRVYIIDEVHMLSINAFNALLKIMEEPPAHVIFILATTEVHQVPVTIISRCQRFDFERIDDELIISRLEFIAGEEGIELDGDAARIIACLADGGMRDALSLFDQCASYDNHVTGEIVSKVSGQADPAFVGELTQALCSENTAQALALTTQAHKRSLSFSFIASELILFFRDTMVAKSVGISDPSLFRAGRDLEDIKKHAEKLPLSQIMYCLDVLSNTLNLLGRAAYPGVMFEQCMIRLCSPFLSTDSQALAARVDKLEKRILSVPTDFSPFAAKSAGSATAEKQKPEAQVSTASHGEVRSAAQAAPRSASASAKADGKKEPFSLWKNVLEMLLSSNPPLYGALRNSKAYIEGDVVYIDTNDFTFALLKGSANNRDTLKAAVAAVSGNPLKIAQYKEKAYTPESDAMAEILKRAQKNGVDVE